MYWNWSSEEATSVQICLIINLHTGIHLHFNSCLAVSNFSYTWSVFFIIHLNLLSFTQTIAINLSFSNLYHSFQKFYTKNHFKPLPEMRFQNWLHTLSMESFHKIRPILTIILSLSLSLMLFSVYSLLLCFPSHTIFVNLILKSLKSSIVSY